VYRKIYEQFYNVKIPKGFHIHHIDGNRQNNDPKNLIMVSPEEHYQIHLQQNDPVCRHGKFISGAAVAGKKGGSSISDKKRKSSSINLSANRRPDLGAKASVESRKESKTFFFSEQYQKDLQERMKREKIGPWSDDRLKSMSIMGKSKGKCPIHGDKKWNSTYEASAETGIPASTLRYRCRNNILGWSYDEQ
jgi:hypothetical protein